MDLFELVETECYDDESFPVFVDCDKSNFVDCDESNFVDCDESNFVDCDENLYKLNTIQEIDEETESAEDQELKEHQIINLPIRETEMICIQDLVNQVESHLSVYLNGVIKSPITYSGAS